MLAGDWAMKRLIPFLVAVLAVPIALSGQDVPITRFTASTNTWDLQTSAMRAEFQLTPAGVFQFVFFTNTDKSIQFLPPSGASVTPISLQIDGNPIDENTPWTLMKTGASSTLRGGAVRSIVLQNAQLNLQVTVYLQVDPDQPFFRYWLDVTNQSTATHTITTANFLNWSWQSGGQNAHAFIVNQYRAGAPFFFNLSDVDLTTQAAGATVFSGAHGDDCGWLALAFPNASGIGSGLVAGWEFDGRAHITATQATAGSPLQVSGGPDALYLTVDAGKTVALPAAFLGLYNGDWDEAGYRTQRYVEQVVAQPLPDEGFPYVMFDTWAYEEAFDETSLRTMAARAASMGVEVFIIDLGWTRSIGDYRYNVSKFRTGLKGFSDYVHSLGMKLGLHWTPAEASTVSPVMTLHPEYQATEPSEYFGALGLCLGNTPGQDWARSAIDAMVTNYNFDWVTQDGENLVKECTDPKHTHNPANSNWDNSVNGIDSLVATMRTKHPNLLWENNADGGDMLTFQMVKNYVTADSCDACGEDQRLQAVFGMTYPFSPRYVERYVTGGPAKWTIRTSDFGGPLILMEQISTWTQAEVKLVTNEVAIYKSLRATIRDGKVYHLGPAPTSTTNSAIESYNELTDNAVIFAYRPEGPDDSLTIVPRGLRPAGIYKVSMQESTKTWAATGAELMANGFSVSLGAQDTAEIIYINTIQASTGIQATITP